MGIPSCLPPLGGRTVACGRLVAVSAHEIRSFDSRDARKTRVRDSRTDRETRGAAMFFHTATLAPATGLEKSRTTVRTATVKLDVGRTLALARTGLALAAAGNALMPDH